MVITMMQMSRVLEYLIVCDKTSTNLSLDAQTASVKNNSFSNPSDSLSRIWGSVAQNSKGGGHHCSLTNSVNTPHALPCQFFTLNYRRRYPQRRPNSLHFLKTIDSLLCRNL